MGTFIGYIGDMSIPEENREEFTNRVMKILHEGGMFWREYVRIDGKELILLAPYHVGRSGAYCVDYNYFEDSAWEVAGYDPETAVFFTNKVGNFEFNAVLSAIYVLYEFYTESFGIAEEDGEPYNASPYIRWLNQLFFGEAYTNERAMDLWRIYELLPEDERDVNLLELMNDGDADSMNIAGAAKYMLLANDVSIAQLVAMPQPEDEELHGTDTIMTNIRAFYKSLRAFCQVSEKTPEENLERVIQLLAYTGGQEGNGIKLNTRNGEWALLLTGKFLPPEITAKCISEVFNIDYATAMADYGTRIPDRSDIWNKDAVPLKPLPPMSTADFLTAAHRTALYSGELHDIFRVTDDKRLYWWSPGGTVHLSNKMWNWLLDLREEWQSIRDNTPLMDAVSAQKLWMDTLIDANETYTNVYCFRDVFYEFIMQAERAEVQAAILLLKRLVDCNREQLEEQENKEYWVKMLLLDQPARTRIKSYLALLANHSLREKLFDF